MKTIIGRIRTAPLLAVLIALAAAGAGAAAPTPVAKWNGDLANGSTKGKYTMSSDSSVVSFANNKATLTSSSSVASKGVQITWPDPTSDAESFTSKKMSVVIQYSGLSILNGNTSLLAALWGENTKEYMIRTSSGNGTAGIATGVTSSSSGTQSNPSPNYPDYPAPTKGRLLAIFSGDSSCRPGMDLYFSTYNDSTGAYGDYQRVAYWSDKKVDNGKFYGIKVGGTIASTGAYYRPGMTVEAVQIYDDVVAFDYTASLSESSTWTDLVWDKEVLEGFPALLNVNVTEDATLNLDGATITAQSINFNIASGKTLTLEGTATIPAARIFVTGGGKLKLNTSNPGCAITVASGGTMDSAVETVSCAIINNGTINADGCAFNGAVSNSGTLNTSGTVSFSSNASNTSSGTFNVVSGTTTYNSNSQKGISGTLNIAKNATLINGKQDSILWDGTVHVHIRGIVTMNDKWTIGANNYIHLYDGALVNGSASNAFHFNSGEGKIIAETGSSTITAPFVKGGGTIAKSGSGTLRLENQRLPSIEGSEGTIEVVSTVQHADSKHSHTDSNIPFSGTVKFITSSSPSGQYHMLLWSNSATAGMFANRPALDVSGEVRLYDKIATYPLKVRNLCGTGTIRMGGGTSVSGYRYIDTSQTANTVFDGMFTTISTHAAYDSALTVRGAVDATKTYSLTLTGANNTTGPLVIENNAKVIFSSTGKWSGGTVTVASGGVLESQNSESIAARLVVQEGATLKFANGVPLAAKEYDWSGVSNDQSVNVDLSGIAPSATPVTLIASDVTVEAGKFKVTSAPCPVDISVVDGALKVAFSNYWSDGAWIDTPVSNKDAMLRISQNSTLTVSEALSLGAVTVVKVGDSDVTLTISGAGALTTDGWTIPAGVTVVTADGMEIAGDVTGGGVINVPANTTLTMDGVTTSGDTLADRVKVAVFGTLKTKGLTTLSAANTSAAGSLIEVVAGTNTLSSAFKGLSGNITIDSGAELSWAESISNSTDQYYDHINPAGTTVLDIAGTLHQNYRMTEFGANNKVLLRAGALVDGSTGSTDLTAYYGYGHWTWLDSGLGLHTYGNAELAIYIRTPENVAPEFTVDENAVLTISQAFIPQTGRRDGAGSIVKAGLGTLSLSGFAMSKPMTINAGKVVVDTAPTASSFAIAEGATFTLNTDLNSSVGEGQYTGAGTLELENLSGDKWYLQNINFSGIIKTKNAGGNYWIGGANSNGGLAPLFSGTPELIAESGTQLINRNFNAATLPIRDLSGGATITVGNYDNENDANKTRTVSSKQTKNTTFSGVFASQDTCSTSLEVYGNTSAANLYALTLSGVNTTVGGLTVRDNAKVAFASSGSWANGTVSVNDGGWIESTNTSAMTTLSLADGAGIVVPYVASAAVPLTATTITLPASGTINVDLSAVDVAANETVAILSATTLNNADASLFMQTSGDWRFAVEGNTVTATKLGALTWDATNEWSTDDFSGYTEATINVTGTQKMALNVSPSIENLTINGTSTPRLTITPSSGNAISAQNVTLGSGVVVYLNGAALNVTGGTIKGGTEIDVNSGATLTLEDVDCESKLNVHGTVVTKGKVNLSVNSVPHVFQTDGTLSVESGITQLSNRTGDANGFSGVMDIKSSAKLIAKTTNALAYSRNTVVVDVHGTLEFDSDVSWLVGSINTINLYDGGQIIGTKTDIGNLDLRGAKVYAKGNATIDANVRAYDDTTTTISVDADKTLTIKKVFATNNSTGTITKEGEGTLKLEDANCSSADRTTEPTIAGSEGTVEFYASTNHRYLNKPSTFSGNVKFTQGGSNELVVQNTALFSNRPALEVSGGFTMHNTLSAANVALQVRDLSGSGTVSPKFGDGTVARIVDTQQTTDTTFNGTFIHHVNNSNNDRNTGLKVTSVDTQVHKLTLTGDNDTTGPLTISSYGKVLFTGSGSWTNGNVTVGANGYLELENVAAVTLLTLADGANIVFPASSSKLSSISALTFASGTTKIHFGSGVTPTAGPLIDWSAANLEAAPAGAFALADSTLAGEWILTKSAAGLSIAAAGAQIVYSNGDVVPCAAVDASTYAAFMTAIGTDEGATLRILDNTSIDTETITTLASQGLYYDSATKTISKAVAKVNTAVYPSLASAVAAAADGDSVYLQRASTETITINAKAITLVQTAAFSGTLSGNGTITLQTLSTSLHFDSWTGTVALPAFTTDVALALNDYGVAGSTVRVSGSAGWLKNGQSSVIPNVELGGDWTLPHFSPSFDYTLAKLSGTYKFKLGASSIDSQTPYFLVKDVSGFTGSLETSAAGIVLGSQSKPDAAGHGGKILVYGDVTVGEGATWTAPNGVVLMEDSATLTVPSGATVPEVATSVANSYAKAVAGESSTVYSVGRYNTVTFEGANMTATRTDELESAIKDGDKITFTVASAEGYVVTGVTATLAGGSPETLTADNGVYSYVVNGNVTIAVTAAQVATVAEPSFDVYYADYSKAQTVTVAASDYVEGSVYTLQVGNGAAVDGTYANGTVTFADVTGFTPGTAVNYTITVSGAAAGTKSGTVTAAAATATGWVREAKNGLSQTGTWTPSAPVFGEAGSATLSGETTFTARAQASGKVALTTVVNFANEADPTLAISADAKAAIKVENDSFRVWTKTTVAGEKGASADWLTVSGATPNLEAVSTVVFTFDTDAKTFTVSVDGAALYYGESNAHTSFAFASDGVAISSVAYKGAGSFTSLTGEYTTTDVTTSVDGKQVVVANSFISGNETLRAMTVAEAAAALAPGAPVTDANKNGLNYFTSYALGLDPTKKEDKPIVDVTTDTEGKFVFTVKHPVYNEQGEITGYVAINAADNVSTTVTLKYGTDASSITTVEEGAASGISPADMFDHAGAGNVIYYKAEVKIGAK